MSDTLGEMKVKISADTSALVNTFKKIQGPLDDISKNLQRMGRNATFMGAAINAAFMVTLKKAADAGDEINDLSLRTGVATETLSGYKLAADKSGSSIGELAIGMRGLANNMQEAATKGGSAQDVFNALGISVKNADGTLRPLDDVMLDVADRFSKMEDGARKTALAQDIFGRSGMALIPMLNLGRQGLENEARAAEKLGLVFSKESAKACDDFNDSLADLKGGIQGVSIQVGMALMPAFNGFIDKATIAVSSITAWAREHPELTRVISGTGLALGSLATVAGSFLMLAGTLISKLGILATTFHTTAGAIAATTALYTAGIAVVGLYIGKIIELKAAIARADEADKQFVDSNIKLSNKLYELVTSGKMAIDTYYDLWDKFEGNAAAMAVYIKEGKAGKVAQEGLVEIGKKHAAAIEEQKKKTESFIPVLDTHVEKVKTLAEELNITTRADLQEKLKKLNAALIEYKGKLTFNELMKLKGAINDVYLEMASLADMPKPTVGKAIFEDLSKIKGAWPEVSDTYEKIKGGLGDMADKSKETTAETRGYFDGLFNDIATGFGSTIQEWLTGATTFKDFLEGIWGNIKDSFFRMIGEMASSAVLGKFKDLFSGIASAGKDALGGISKVAGNIGQAAGSAASGFLSALGSVGSIITGITSVISLLQGPQKQTDVTFWLKLSKDLQQEMHDWMFINAQEKLNYFAEKLEDIKQTILDGCRSPLNAICEKLDWIGNTVEDISGFAANLKNLTKAAVGYEGVVSKPTLFLAGERGPEYVSIMPRLAGAGGASAGGQAVYVTNEFRISAIDGVSVLRVIKNQVIPELDRYYNHGGRIPAKAIGD